MARRKLPALLLVFVIGAVAVRGESWTIATYNVENYVATNRMTDAGYRQDYPKPEAQKRALRQVILALQADVLLLQEMGGEAYFAELRRDLKLAGLDYPFAVLLEADDPDRHVALLAKRPAASIVRHTGIEFPYFGKNERVKRGLLEARFETSAGPLVVFGLHLKSRFTDRPDDPKSAKRRIGEASAIRDIILQRCPNPAATPFIVLGDFNDDKASKALLRLRQRGRTPIAAIVAAADSRGETWTHAYAKEDTYTRVDHILASAALRTGGPRLTARIYDGDGVAEASDHRPVVVTLEFPQK